MELPQAILISNPPLFIGLYSTLTSSPEVSVGGEWVLCGEERLLEFVHEREWFGSVREEVWSVYTAKSGSASEGREDIDVIGLARKYTS
jgi:hypothetical protein